MDAALRDQIISIINDVNDMTIATVREDGFPQATTVSYFSEDTTIYFMTTSNSQKANNLSKNNKVSLTIDRDYATWDDIESLSMAAYAHRVTDPKEQERIGSLLMKKFPQVADLEQDENMEVACFRLEPTVISVIDYKKGFGHTELVTL